MGCAGQVTAAGAHFDRIFHMASPARPVGYVKHQVLTLKVNASATMALVGIGGADEDADVCGVDVGMLRRSAWSIRRQKAIGGM